jgi:hypothetical protein
MTRALVKKTRGFANWDQNFQIYFSKMLASTNNGKRGQAGCTTNEKTGGAK